MISSFPTYLGHKRILRVNNCNEELDNGQFIVQIKSNEAHQRIQIAHLRVGAPTPQVKRIFFLLGLSILFRICWLNGPKKCKDVKI